MALSMSRPWRHPDSGFYWFRKRVPDDLRNLLGKREEKFSLGTRDPIEAKRLHALIIIESDESLTLSITNPLGTSDEIRMPARMVLIPPLENRKLGRKHHQI